MRLLIRSLSTKKSNKFDRNSDAFEFSGSFACAVYVEIWLQKKYALLVRILKKKRDSDTYYMTLGMRRTVCNDDVISYFS